MMSVTLLYYQFPLMVSSNKNRALNTKGISLTMLNSQLP